jgi:hypothetical protein
LGIAAAGVLLTALVAPHPARLSTTSKRSARLTIRRGGRVMANRGRGLAWRADAVEGARAAVKFPSRQPGRRSRPPVRRFEAIVSAASEPDAIPRREPLHTLTGGPVSGVTSAGRAAHEVRPRFRIVLSFVEEGLCRRTIRQSNLPPRPWIPRPSCSWQVMGERRFVTPPAVAVGAGLPEPRVKVCSRMAVDFRASRSSQRSPRLTRNERALRMLGRKNYTQEEIDARRPRSISS